MCEYLPSILGGLSLLHLSRIDRDKTTTLVDLRREKYVILVFSEERTSTRTTPLCDVRKRHVPTKCRGLESKMNRRLGSGSCDKLSRLGSHKVNLSLLSRF